MVEYVIALAGTHRWGSLPQVKPGHTPDNWSARPRSERDSRAGSVSVNRG
jgi:hypothetical protein